MSWVSGVTVSLISHNYQPIGYRPSDNAFIYNAQNANGYWDVYCNNRSLTAISPSLVWTHRGASDLRGAKMLVTTARSQIIGSAPGQGATNDIVLINLTNRTARTLVSGREGIIWARWHPTKDRICWAEQTKTALQAPPFGNQIVHVADVTSKSIANEIAYSSLPAGFYETYGWMADGERLLFASNATTGNWLKTTFYTMLDGAPSITSLGNPLLPANGYHEFAFVAPAGMFDDGDSSLLVGWANGTLGLELWRLLDTGSSGRLTYFNPGFGLGVGQLAFDPTDPKKLSIGVKISAAGAIDGYELIFP